MRALNKTILPGYLIIHTKTIINSRTLCNYSSFFSIIYQNVHYIFPNYLSVDQHTRNSHNLKFSVKSLIFLGLMCFKPNFAQKLLKKAKVTRGCETCKKLLTIGTGLPVS